MPLGPQFENTYWFTGNKVGGEDDEVGFSLAPRSWPSDQVEEERGLRHLLGSRDIPHLAKPHIGYGHRNAIDMMRDEGYGSGQTQGMLLSPYVGSGLKEDPLVPLERRQDAAERGMGFVAKGGFQSHKEGYRRDLDSYRVLHATATDNPGSSFLLTQEEMDNDVKTIGKALVDSPMPIHEMERLDTNVVRNPKPGRSSFRRDYTQFGRSAGLINLQKSLGEISSGASHTLAHELGHSQDPTRNSRLRTPHAEADVMAEGLADGYADRFSAHPGVLSSHFSSSLYDPTGRSGPNPGYTDRNKEFQLSGWADPEDRALYVATRSHVAQGDDNYKTVPDKERVINELKASGVQNITHPDRKEPPRFTDDKTLNPINLSRITLGHTWEHYPHVRQHLEDAGYGDAARGAHKDYLRLTNRLPQEEAAKREAAIRAIEDRVPLADRPRYQPTQKETLF